MRHTPGKWFSYKSKRLGHLGIPLKPYMVICVGHEDQTRAKMICQVGIDTNAENVANADLIESAPEMLDLIQAFFQDQMTLVPRMRNLALCEMAGAILLKNRR